MRELGRGNMDEHQQRAEQEHKPTLSLLSRRLRHLLRILRWFRHFKGPETNKADDALRQITDFLDKVRLTEGTVSSLSHPLVPETLLRLIKWRHQALETQRAIKWDIKQKPPYDSDSVAVDRIQHVYTELLCYMATVEHYADVFEADDILYRSIPRERIPKPWDAKQQKFAEEHKDFLRKIAMEVFALVLTPDKRAYFRKQVEAFSHKVEDHQKELEKIKKDYEANSKLQEAARKLNEQIENTPVIEELGCSDLQIDLDMTNGWGMLESFKDYVYYAGGFWGPQTEKVNLVHYLSHFPNFHLGDFEKIPNEAEKLICSYTLLTTIHDKYIKEKPIFFDKPDYLYYNSNPQHWVVTIEQRCDCFNAISGGFFDSVKDTQAWIKRALEEIKADLAGIGKTTVEQKTESYKETINSKKRNKKPTKSKSPKKQTNEPFDETGICLPAEMPSEHDQIETFDDLYCMLGSDLQEYGCVLGQTHEAAIIAGISIRRKYAAKGFSLPEMSENPTATKLMDWCTTCEQTIRAGKPKQQIKPVKELLLESIRKAYAAVEKLTEANVNFDKVTNEEINFAEAAVIEYLTKRFGEQDDALGNWPSDWHECPEAFDLYKEKIRVFQAQKAKAILDEVKQIAETQPEQKIESGKKAEISQWNIPKGYIGSKTIVADYNLPRSTLQGWAERDNPKVKKDPQTKENYYPQKWFDRCWKKYKPRSKA